MAIMIMPADVENHIADCGVCETIPERLHVNIKIAQTTKRHIRALAQKEAEAKYLD